LEGQCLGELACIDLLPILQDLDAQQQAEHELVRLEGRAA
jgi:hypothetical protein